MAADPYFTPSFQQSEALRADDKAAGVLGRLGRTAKGFGAGLKQIPATFAAAHNEMKDQPFDLHEGRRSLNTLLEGGARLGMFARNIVPEVSENVGYKVMNLFGDDEDAARRYYEELLDQRADALRARGLPEEKPANFNPAAPSFVLPKSVYGDAPPYDKAADAVSMLLPIPGVGEAEGALKAAAGKAISKIPGAAMVGEKLAQLPAKAAGVVEKAGSTLKSAAEAPTKAVDAITGKAPEVLKSTPAKVVGAGALAQSGLATPLTKAAAVLTGARILGGAVEDTGAFFRHLAETDPNSISRLVELSKSTTAPKWIKNLAGSLNNIGAGDVAKTGLDIAKSAGAGAASGAALGVASGQSPEEVGQFAGMGTFMGGAGRSLGKITGADAAAARLARDQHFYSYVTTPVEKGGLGLTPEQAANIDDYTRLTVGAAHAIDPKLKFNFVDPAQMKAQGAALGQAGAGAFYDPTSHSITLPLGDKTFRVSHELEHAFMSALGADNETRGLIDSQFTPQQLDIARREYARRLVTAETNPGVTLSPAERAARVQEKVNQLNQGQQGPNWIYNEIAADAGAGVLQKTPLADIAAGNSNVWQRVGNKARAGLLNMLGIDADAEGTVKNPPPAGRLFSNDAIYENPKLRQMVYNHVRQVYRGAQGEGGIKVTPGMWGKFKGAPLHDQGNGTKGNDFVEQKPNGQIVQRPPAQTKRIVRSRQQEVNAAFPVTDTPVAENDTTPEVKMRTTPAGLIQRSGTFISDKLDKMKSFGDAGKAMAKVVEAAIKNGGALSGWYQQIGEGPDWKQSVGKETGNIQAQYKDFVPYDFVISKNGNISVRNYSLTAFDRKAGRWSAAKGPLSLDLWSGDVGHFTKDVQQYLKNHSQGLPGAEGIGDQKRDVINAFLVGANKTFEEKNPLRAQLRGQEDKQGIIRSYRLDRLETLEPSDRQFGSPQYNKQVRNLSPDVSQNGPGARLNELAAKTDRTPEEDTELKNLRAESAKNNSIEAFRKLAQQSGSKFQFSPDVNASAEDQVPEPGKPFEFNFLRRTKPAANMGEMFGQHIEPAGRYMQQGDANDVTKREGMEAGKVRFENPLVIPWGEGYQSPENWKAVLSRQFGGLTGKKLSQEIRNAGYDGIVTTKDGHTSEIVDLSSFKPEARNLVGIHNLNEGKLRHVLKIGGLAVPSIAITRPDKFPFEGFGDISLVAHPDLIDPSKNPVVNSDAYSPRYPTVHYFLDQKGHDVLGDMVDKAVASLPPASQRSFSRYNLTNEMPQKGIRDALKNSEEAKLLYLADQGKLPEFRKVGPEEYSQQAADRYAVGHAIGYSDENLAPFHKWIDDLASKLGLKDTEKIYKGFTNTGRKSYVPHTLENVVRELKKGFRDSEGFNYGAGNVRATVAKKFRTLSSMQAEREKIISSKEMDKLKEQTNDELIELAQKWMPYRENHVDGFHMGDAFADDLKAMAQGGSKNWQYLREQYPGGEPFEEMRAFLDKLKNMPTEYFESKPRRAVGLHEFVGAVVPDNVSPETIAALEKRGLDVVKYPKSDENARRQAVWDMSQKQRVSFSPDVGEESTEQWLERHGVETDGRGRYRFYHGTPVVGGAKESLRAGTLLAKSREKAAFFAARDRELKPEQVRVHELWLTPDQIIPGVHPSLRSEIKLPKSEETPEFKDWFGDSKVVDGEGKPLVVYHGTPRQNVKTIRPEKAMEVPGAAFFSDNEDLASQYTLPREYGESVYEDEDGNEIEPGQTVPTYLSIQNPLVTDFKGEVGDATRISKLVRQAKAAGNDGLIIHNVRDGMADSHETGTSYAIFQPTQVKHASENKGTFDKSNPDIRFSPNVDTAEREKENGPVWFSQLQKVIEDKMPGKAAVGHVRNLLDPSKGYGVKPDEVKWTGLDDWLAQQKGTVTKQQVLDYLRDNNPEITEVANGGESEWSFHPEWSDLTYAFDEPSDEDPDKPKYEYVGELSANSDRDSKPLVTLWHESNGKIYLGDATGQPLYFSAHHRYNNFDNLDEAKEAGIEEARKIYDQEYGAEKNTRYSDYKLHGGENYTELLFTLPIKEAESLRVVPHPEFEGGFALQWPNGDYVRNPYRAGQERAGGITKWSSATDAANHGIPHYDEQNYHSPHWNEKNVLAHVRFDEREVPSYTPAQIADIGQRLVEAVGAKSEDSLGSGAPEVGVKKGVITPLEAAQYSRARGFRSDTTGAMNRVLFLEELQSDWHKEGRKKGYRENYDVAGTNALKEKHYARLREIGKLATEEFAKSTEAHNFGTPEDQAAAKLRLDSAKEQLSDTPVSSPKYQAIADEYKNAEAAMKDIVPGWGRPDNDFSKVEPGDLARVLENNIEVGNVPKENFGPLAEEARRIKNELDFIREGERKNEERVPDAPFKNTWHEMVFRRMVRWAAENGFDKLAWTTGQQQIDRYDLSKHVDKISTKRNEDGTYNYVAFKNGANVAERRNLSASQLSEHISKPLAMRTVQSEDPRMDYSGLDLKVGGAGKKKLYDNMLVDYANKFGKKFGAKVQDLPMNVTDAEDSEFQKYPAEHPYVQKNMPTVHSLPITPEMKASVMKGQALFSPKLQDDPGWSKNFPDLATQTTISRMKSLPDYEAAKGGDRKAALNVAQQLFNPRRVAKLAKQFPDATLVPVRAIERSGRNKLPQMYAHVLADEFPGWTVDKSLVQSSRAHHTGANAAERAIRVPEFDGKVEKGKNYILVDDVATSGSTFAALRNYIQERGGKVVAATALATTNHPQLGYGGHLAIKPETLTALKSKFDIPQLERLLSVYGIAKRIRQLTNSQGRYILTFSSLDRFRDRISEAGGGGGRQLGAGRVGPAEEGSQSDLFPGQ